MTTNHFIGRQARGLRGQGGRWVLDLRQLDVDVVNVILVCKTGDKKAAPMLAGGNVRGI